MEYQRVIPRDLFNESKLLKCIGQLCLKIHDNQTPVKMSVEQNQEGEPFEIGLLEEGALCILNLNISIQDKVFIFKTTYNSKANYPLYLDYDYCDYEVFDDKGEFTQTFIDFCNSVNELETV